MSGREQLGGNPEPGAADLHEVLGQQRGVARPLAERRNAQLKEPQPVQQVGAEAPGRHQRLQVNVGGCDDADVSVFLDPAAEWPVLMILEEPQ